MFVFYSAYICYLKQKQTIVVSLSNSFWMLPYVCVGKMRFFNHFDVYMHYYSLSFITAVMLHLVCAGLKEK